MSVEFTDILQMKKHRGKSVREVMDTEPSYLLWLRDEKLAGVGAGYFDPTVLRELNQAIKDDKRLAKKFTPWTELPDGTFSPIKPGASAGGSPASAVKSAVSASFSDPEPVATKRPSLTEITAAQEREDKYDGMWGCF